ncbi:MAG: hypothetical protein EXS05_14750 [Planctomycetaceae bacterium]|nr:hypothetical protein [Planctomycetaceae bacterium]
MSRRLETVDALLGDLASKDARVRDGAALRLREVAQATVKIAIEQAKKRTNKGYTGTLIWLLHPFDCSQHFTELFELALFGDYEEYCMAWMILRVQCFDVTEMEIRTARNKLRSLKVRDGLSADELPLMKRELQATLTRISRRRATLFETRRTPRSKQSRAKNRRTQS